MRHPKLKPEWEIPKLPKGYTDIGVCLGRSGNVIVFFTELEGGKLKKYSLLSELDLNPIEWPWKPGVEVLQEDWRAIGFSVSTMFDCCFGSPDPKYIFRDWSGKD